MTYHGDDTTSSISYSNIYNDNFFINGNKYTGTLDIELLYKDINKYTTLYIIIFAITITLLSIMYFSIKNLNKPLEKIFLILALPIYLLYMFVIPPEVAHDEKFHWHRVFEITEGGILTSINENMTGYELPYGVEMNLPLNNKIKYSDILNERSTLDYSKSSFVNNATMGVYSPVQYMPQVMGVTLSKQFTHKTIIIYYIGRLFNLISCILLLYFAIKKIPYLKKLMFLISFIPIAVEGFTTMSGDGMLISTVFLFIAYIMSIIKSENILTKKDYAILILLGIFIAFSKIVYIPIIGLLLLIPNKNFKNKDKYKKVIPMIAFLLIINLIWLVIASKYLQVYTTGKSTSQINYIFSNIFDYAKIFIYSTTSNSFELIYQAFGKYLLWDELITNNIIPIVLIVISFILVINDKEKHKYKLSDIILLILIILLIISLTFTSIYIQWDAYRSNVIYGVQGRYFLPILLIPFIIFNSYIKPRKLLNEKTTTKIVIITSILVSYIILIEVITQFL